MATRTVSLALVDATGQPLGTIALPEPAGSPWWQEVAEIVDQARTALGIDVTVLRLLSADQPAPPGGAVTYLAQCDAPPPVGLHRCAAPVDWTAPHPLRMPWANPGGPAATLAWARAALDRPVRAARQLRTWNLSSIWRLSTDDGPAWVKEVPPFFAHEGAVLRWLAGTTTPVLLARDGGRLLLADLPGTDQYRADGQQRAPMLATLLDIQADAAARLPELVAAGVPDQRADVLCRQVDELPVDALAPEDRADLAELVAGLPARLTEVAACGVPDTLVHGDFHPGNVRAGHGGVVIFDWGDSVIGHPAFDLIRMRDWREPTPELADQWCRFWREAVPGSAPEHALDLLAPVAALRDAVDYHAFLRSIEPAERPYHAGDVTAGLLDAVQRHRTHK